MTPVVRVVSLAAVAALMAACSSVDDAEWAASPSPLPSTAEAVTTLQPTEPLDLAAFYGIGTSGTGTDQYGTYAHLSASDPWLVVDLDDAIVSAAAREELREDALMVHARSALDFLVSVVIDSPLVFDDSPEAQELFWRVADGYFLQVEPFSEFFASRADGGDFSLADDDRLEWRQAAGYQPAPYSEDTPRARIRELTLARVDYKTGDFPGPSFTFRAVYARPVVKSTGEHVWERVTTRYTISIGYRVDGRPGISGLNFNGRTQVGIYVKDGWKGLPEVERTSQWEGAVVEDGHGVVFPVFDGWSTTSDMEQARERGIQLDDADVPHAVPAYFAGVGESPDHAPYLVTRVDPAGDDPYVSKAEASLDEAGLPDEYFWPEGAQGGRLAMQGARYATVELRRADPDGHFDVVIVDVLDVLGWRHQAEYYVDAGTGAKRLTDIVNGLRLDPVAMATFETGA